LRFIEANGIEALKNVAQSEPQLASVVLGKIIPRALGNSKANDDLVFSHIENLCAVGLDMAKCGSRYLFLRQKRSDLMFF